jgi:hypothetical protein
MNAIRESRVEKRFDLVVSSSSQSCNSSCPSSHRRRWNVRSWWSTPPRCSCRPDVNFQISDRSA